MKLNNRLLKVAKYLGNQGLYEDAAQIKKLAQELEELEELEGSEEIEELEGSEEPKESDSKSLFHNLMDKYRRELTGTQALVDEAPWELKDSIKYLVENYGKSGKYGGGINKIDKSIIIWFPDYNNKSFMTLDAEGFYAGHAQRPWRMSPETFEEVVEVGNAVSILGHAKYNTARRRLEDRDRALAARRARGEIV